LLGEAASFPPMQRSTHRNKEEGGQKNIVQIQGQLQGVKLVCGG